MAQHSVALADLWVELLQSIGRICLVEDPKGGSPQKQQSAKDRDAMPAHQSQHAQMMSLDQASPQLLLHPHLLLQDSFAQQCTQSRVMHTSNLSGDYALGAWDNRYKLACYDLDISKSPYPQTEFDGFVLNPNITSPRQQVDQWTALAQLLCGNIYKHASSGTGVGGYSDALGLHVGKHLL